MPSFCLSILFCTTIFSSSQTIPNTSQAKSSAEPDVGGKTFDYIVVGGGLTGLTVANRLSEDGDRSVLVIENGFVNDDVSTQIPAFGNSLNTDLMYDIPSAPNANIDDQSFPVYVGNVVGGGSVINGMALDRASAADYDAWEQLGNNGWNWNSLLYYFKKSTTFTPPVADNVKNFGITYDSSYYGTDGPIQASFPNFEYPDTKTIWKSFKAEGIPLPREHAAGTAVGALWIPTALQPKNQTRSQAKNAYYDPVKSRSNLVLITGKRVNEILFDQSLLTGLKAKGVQFVSRSDQSVKQVYAKREVILAAGAVFTPQLLQLSGLGPKDVLTAAGVKVKKDMPAVGANMQDHPNAYAYFDLKNMSTPNPFSLLDPVYMAAARAQYDTNKTGPYTQAHGSSIAFLSLQSITEKYSQIVNTITAQNARSFLPSVYADSTLLRGFQKQRDIIANLYSRSDAAAGEVPMVPFGVAISALQRPLSRGTVTLNPSNKYGNPVVQWNTFQNPVDRQILVEMVRWTRKHWARTELNCFSPIELIPGVEAQTDDEIIDALIQHNYLQASFAHMSGSCSMMPQSYGGVVASDLTVYNTKGLSIVDASIIPLIPATHLQATMYAVAEKAADLIKARNSATLLSSLLGF
ncbi:GMC oxidoreductase [Dothidotthia symphoricarpi CBS 119687]|uniref:GMC oxidoreductase n=1 Tax=Dothidotthia symphoricarpi CBS 119687 TaxID=1392245 RepID=A0A6A6ASZ7_9PLEO|nr:GMC oxidoreductase [Dothidotthia symphoricarpi CBS 119687]KAF2134343.1 GMC oxidoreductase [Dothidotthia symphoricarpi CBS 119687]